MGVDAAACSRLATRDALAIQLPNRFLMIQLDEDATHCIDIAAAREDGECCVICYQHFSGHVQLIASSFHERREKDVFP